MEQPEKRRGRPSKLPPLIVTTNYHQIDKEAFWRNMVVVLNEVYEGKAEFTLEAPPGAQGPDIAHP